MEPPVLLRVLQEKACLLATIKRHYAIEKPAAAEGAAGPAAGASPSNAVQGKTKKATVSVGGLGQLSQMLSEAVAQQPKGAADQQCRVSLGLSATPLHDFSQVMVQLKDRPDKWPSEPRVGPQVAQMFQELHSFHDSCLAYSEGRLYFSAPL